MDDIKFSTREDMGAVEFKTAFKGYNIAEVNEYIATQRAELEDIRAENAELYKRIEKLKTQNENLKKKEEDREKRLESTKDEADRIIRDAKKKAAQELLRANRKCSLMVAEMTEQVDEQKRLYQATKIEAAKFRNALFALYRDHIELINAMSEASGAFDEGTSGVTDEELADMEKLLDSDEEYSEEEYAEVDQSAFASEGQTLLVEAFSDTASITIPPSEKSKKNKGRKKVEKAVSDDSGNAVSEVSGEIAGGDYEKAETADVESEITVDLGEDENGESNEPESFRGEKALDNAVDKGEDALLGESSMFRQDGHGAGNEDNRDDFIVNDSSEKSPESLYTEARASYDDDSDEYYSDMVESDGEDDFGMEEILEKKSRIHKKTKRSREDTAFVMTEEDLDEFTNPDGTEMEYDGPVSVDSVFKKTGREDADFEMLYGDGGDRFSGVRDYEEDMPPRPENKKSAKTNSYGFNVTSMRKNDPDDDSNEFYMESDAEFDPSASDGIPTGTVSAFGITSQAPATERRWKVKRSKSLTDEFDVVKADADEE